MHPDEFATFTGNQYYPLEVQQQQQCSLDINTNLLLDPRYINTGAMDTELDVQSLSGVLPALLKLPLYNQYVPNPVVTKTATQYNFWARPTLPWNRTCESQGLTKQMVVQTLSNTYDPKPAGSQNVIAIIAGCFIILFLTVGFLIGFTICGCTYSDQRADCVDKAIPIGGYIMVGIQIGMSVMCGVYVTYTVPSFAQAMSLVSNYSIVNGCVD